MQSNQGCSCLGDPNEWLYKAVVIGWGGRDVDISEIPARWAVFGCFLEYSVPWR